MTSRTNALPSNSYEDILWVNNGGLGLQNIPAQVQDGLGNITLMTLGLTSINFNRGIGQFKIDGIALTADITVLNNLSDAATAEYILVAPNAQLPNAFTFATDPGLAFTTLGSVLTLSPSGQLSGLQNLATTGYMIRTGSGTYATRSIVTDGTITSSNNDGIAGNTTLSVANDSSVQRINVYNDGTLIGTEVGLNLIPGTGVSISGTDSPGNSWVNVKLVATGAIEDIPYVLVTPSPLIPDSRGIQAGYGISVTDGGPQGYVTISATGVTPVDVTTVGWVTQTLLSIVLPIGVVVNISGEIAAIATDLSGALVANISGGAYRPDEVSPNPVLPLNLPVLNMQSTGFDIDNYVDINLTAVLNTVRVSVTGQPGLTINWNAVLTVLYSSV